MIENECTKSRSRAKLGHRRAKSSWIYKTYFLSFVFMQLFVVLQLINCFFRFSLTLATWLDASSAHWGRIKLSNIKQKLKWWCTPTRARDERKLYFQPVCRCVMGWCWWLRRSSISWECLIERSIYSGQLPLNEKSSVRVDLFLGSNKQQRNNTKYFSTFKVNSHFLLLIYRIFRFFFLSPFFSAELWVFLVASSRSIIFNFFFYSRPWSPSIQSVFDFFLIIYFRFWEFSHSQMFILSLAWLVLIQQN